MRPHLVDSNKSTKKDENSVSSVDADVGTTSGKTTLVDSSRAVNRMAQVPLTSLGHPRQRYLLLAGDLSMIALSNFLSLWLRFGTPVGHDKSYTLPFIITMFFYSVTLYVFDMYNHRRLYPSWETWYRTALSVFFGGALSFSTFYLLPEGLYGRGIMAIQMVLAMVLIAGWRYVYSGLIHSTGRKISTIVIGAGECGRSVYELLRSPFSPYEVRAFIDDDISKKGYFRYPPILGSCGEISEVAGLVNAELAILAIPRNRPGNLISNILDARLKGLSVREMADIYEELTGRIPVEYIGDQWLLFTDGFQLLHREYVQRIKRLFDLSVSASLLLFLGPLMGLIALAIKLDSPGPVLYGQTRVGRGESTFRIFKFRSMVFDAEVNGAQWASDNDPRVTRVGHWLRVTHLDELPQAWNVFRGDMSVVGPRPERPEFVDLLKTRIPYYFVRHAVRPGITGWAQVNFRYGASIEDARHKLESDIFYVKNMSLFLDLKILLKTVGVIFTGEGAR